MHREWYKAYSNRYSVHMHEIMETGATVTDEERDGIRADQLRLRHKMEEALLTCGADLWIAPAAPGPCAVWDSFDRQPDHESAVDECGCAGAGDTDG